MLPIISPAHAQSAASIAGFDVMSILPLALIFVVFYFFLIRPQQKKAQQQQNLLSSLRRGDKVVTSGGIIGIISKVINEQELQVEIAEDVRVRVVRAMVADVLSKTEPMDEIPEKSDSKEVKKSTPAPKAKKPAITKTVNKKKKS